MNHYMSPKFGSYLFRNLKGESPEMAPAGDSFGGFAAFEEQPILLCQEDIRTADPKGPHLDWSRFEIGQITVRLKETQGITDGCVTIKASTLQRICPLLLPQPFQEDFLFPVSLKTVVLQIQAQLQRKSADAPKAGGPDFDTPIAQVAREDEGFFKLEKVSQQPSLTAEKPQAKQTSSEPFLTPADHPSFPLIREKPYPAKVGSEVPPLEVALQHPVPQKSALPPAPPSKASLSDELPKVGLEVVKSKEPELVSDHPANQERKEVEDGVEVSGGAKHLAPVEPPARKPPRRAGLERLQEIFMSEDLLDAREVAALIARFPKVSGTLILLGDGTFMGGNLPNEFRSEAVVLAPKLLKTVQDFGNRLKSRDPSAITIFLDQPVSLCSAGNVCILVAHEGRGLLPGMRERICEVAKALDVLYEREIDSSP
jgi:hypothetical protein